MYQIIMRSYMYNATGKSNCYSTGRPSNEPWAHEGSCREVHQLTQKAMSAAVNQQRGYFQY